MTSRTIKTEPESSENLHQICRLCLSQNSLDDVFKEEDLHRWILDYLSIEISIDDCTSQAICSYCRRQLIEFHQFRICCQDVQSVLQSKTEPEDLKNTDPICRLCLSHESLGDVFKEEGLHQWILDYLSIVVSANDGMSQAICPVCRIQLTEFHQFRVRCLDVQDVLLQSRGDNDEKFSNGAGNHSGLDCGTTIRLEEVKEEGKMCEGKHYKKLAVESDHKNHETIESEEKNQPFDAVQKIKSEPREEFDATAGSQDQLPFVTVHYQGNHDEKAEMEQPLETEATEDMIDIGEVKIEPCEEDKKAKMPTVDETFQCNVCQRICMSEYKLKRHKQNAHGPKNHECTICGFKTAIQRDLRQHLTTKQHFIKVHENLNRETSAALVHSEKEKDKVHQNAHQSDGKLESKGLNKPKDEETCSTEEINAELNVEVSASEQNLQCDICHKVFPWDKKKLVDHKWYAHGHAKYKCPICERPFLFKYRISMHMRTHEAIRPREKKKDKDGRVKPFKCEVCQKEFRLKRTCEVHKREMHGLTKNVCQICKRPFAYPYMLKEHTEMYQDKCVENLIRRRGRKKKLGNRNECDLCHKTFTNEHTLYMHKRNQHETKNHVCSTCEKSFSFRFQLERHTEQYKQTCNQELPRGKPNNPKSEVSSNDVKRPRGRPRKPRSEDDDVSAVEPLECDV